MHLDEFLLKENKLDYCKNLFQNNKILHITITNLETFFNIHRYREEEWYQHFIMVSPIMWHYQNLFLLKIEHLEDFIRYVYKTRSVHIASILYVTVCEKDMMERLEEYLSEEETYQLLKQVILINNSLLFLEQQSTYKFKSSRCNELLNYLSVSTWPNIQDKDQIKIYIQNMSLQLAETIISKHIDAKIADTTFVDMYYNTVSFTNYIRTILLTDSNESAIEMIKTMRNEKEEDRIKLLYECYAKIGKLMGYFLVYAALKKEIPELFFNLFLLYNSDVSISDIFDKNIKKYEEYYGYTGRDFYFRLCFSNSICLSHFITKLHPLTEEDYNYLLEHNKYYFLTYFPQYIRKQKLKDMFIEQHKLDRHIGEYMIANAMEIRKFLTDCITINLFQDPVPKSTDADVCFVEHEEIPKDTVYSECSYSSKHATIYPHIVKCGICQHPMKTNLYINTEQ